MKRLFLFFYLPYISLFHSAFGIDGVIDAENKRIELEVEEKKSAINKLSLAKYWLINGHLNKAMAQLHLIEGLDPNVEFIRKRYMAMIYFLKDEYQKSYNILALPFFQTSDHFKHICLMQTINTVAIGKTQNLKEYLELCQSALSDRIVSSYFWTEFFVGLALKDPRTLNGLALSYPNQSIDHSHVLRQWLKNALYANFEHYIVQRLEGLPLEAYENPKLREMIGLALYREKKYDLAFKFIDDLETANAENIKGNLELRQGKMELAYGHFKLALMRKKNSFNAMERLIPLSWLLKNWPDALGTIASYSDRKIDERKRGCFETAVLLKSQEYQLAQENLNYLDTLFLVDRPHLLDLLKMVTAYRLEDHKSASEFAAKSCENNEGMHCWYKLQGGIWKDLIGTLKSSNPTNSRSREDIESLKVRQEVRPIDEPLYLKQSEIDALDFGYF